MSRCQFFLYVTGDIINRKIGQIFFFFLLRRWSERCGFAMRWPWKFRQIHPYAKPAARWKPWPCRLLLPTFYSNSWPDSKLNRWNIFLELLLKRSVMAIVKLEPILILWRFDAFFFVNMFKRKFLFSSLETVRQLLGFFCLVDFEKFGIFASL